MYFLGTDTFAQTGVTQSTFKSNTLIVNHDTPDGTSCEISWSNNNFLRRDFRDRQI